MLSLTAEALVSAPRDVVWNDWTDAGALATWIWPPRLAATADVTLDGAWIVRSEVAGIAVLATVISADPPERLRLAWRWDGEDATTHVDVVFEEAGPSATRVVVRHSGFATEGERESHVEGWTHCLDRLVARHVGGDLPA